MRSLANTLEERYTAREASVATCACSDSPCADAARSGANAGQLSTAHQPGPTAGFPESDRFHAHLVVPRSAAGRPGDASHVVAALLPDRSGGTLADASILAVADTSQPQIAHNAVPFLAGASSPDRPQTALRSFSTSAFEAVWTLDEAERAWRARVDSEEVTKVVIVAVAVADAERGQRTAEQQE